MREMPCGFDYRQRTSLGDARDQRRKMLQLAVIATVALAAGTNPDFLRWTSLRLTP